MKLIKFTDKYLQNDLNEKCMDFLTSNLSSDNVYSILDFARQENIHRLINWCMKFLKNNLTTHNISRLIQYLYRQSNPDFAKENLELNSKALSFITTHYAKLCHEDKTNAKFYEDFLIQNINIDTIVLFAKFLYSRGYQETIRFAPPDSFTAENFASLVETSQSSVEKAKSAFEQNIIPIRNASFTFAAKNFKQLAAKGISKALPNSFLSDLILYILEIPKESA